MRFLADGEPAAGPEAVVDRASAGGEGMRDAAVVACYGGNWLLPESLVWHYYNRTGTGTGRAENTVRRFREAEQQLRDDLDGDGGRPPWISLSQFVAMCKSTHESESLRDDDVQKP